MNVEVGIASYPDIDLPQLFVEAQRLDIDFVELILEGEYRREKASERQSEIRDLASDDVGLIVHLPFGGIDIGSPFEHVREGAVKELKRSITTAVDLGATKAVFHAGTYVHPQIWTQESVEHSLIDSIQELTAHAQQHGITLGMENVPNPFVTVLDFPALFDATAVHATLDTGHARVNEVTAAELYQILEQHGNRFTHVHLNDTRGASDDHLPVGMGSIDFRTMFESLPDHWTGSMTVEAITSDVEYMATGIDQLTTILDDLRR